MVGMGWIYLVIAFILNAAANTFLKFAADRGIILSGMPLIGLLRANIFLLVGLFFFAANVIFYTLALRALPLSLAYPVMVVGTFFLVSTFSAVYFKETVTLIQVIGYAAILGGIALVMLAKG